MRLCCSISADDFINPKARETDGWGKEDDEEETQLTREKQRNEDGGKNVAIWGDFQKRSMGANSKKFANR